MRFREFDLAEEKRKKRRRRSTIRNCVKSNSGRRGTKQVITNAEGADITIRRAKAHSTLAINVECNACTVRFVIERKDHK